MTATAPGRRRITAAWIRVENPNGDGRVGRILRFPIRGAARLRFGCRFVTPLPLTTQSRIFAG